MEENGTFDASIFRYALQFAKADLIKLLCGGLFCIPKSIWSRAERLDIWETDVPKVLEKAEVGLRQQVRSWK